MFDDLDVWKTGLSASDTDATLFQLMLDRDEQAFASLVGRYSGLTYGTSLRILRDPYAAQDVSQAVWLKLWTEPRQYVAERGTLGAWLSTLSRNRSLDQLRRRKRYVPLDEADLPFEVGDQAQVEHQQTFRSIRPLLNQLPELPRRTLEMSFLQELTHAEIADLTGTPLGTIKTRSRLGLIALRSALATSNRCSL